MERELEQLQITTGVDGLKAKKDLLLEQKKNLELAICEPKKAPKRKRQTSITSFFTKKLQITACTDIDECETGSKVLTKNVNENTSKTKKQVVNKLFILSNEYLRNQLFLHLLMMNGVKKMIKNYNEFWPQ